MELYSQFSKLILNFLSGVISAGFSTQHFVLRGRDHCSELDTFQKQLATFESCIYVFLINFFITVLTLIFQKEYQKSMLENFHNLILLECKLQNKFDENMKNLILLPF